MCSNSEESVEECHRCEATNEELMDYPWANEFGGTANENDKCCRDCAIDCAHSI